MVLTGLGNGTFLPPRKFGLDGSPWCAAIGDVNRDQAMDVDTA